MTAEAPATQTRHLVLAARFASELVIRTTLLEQEGAGKAGSLPLPWSACSKKARGRTTGSAKTSRPSLRDGFNGLYVLSPGTGCLAPVARNARHEHRDLSVSTGAPGPHDFAVRAMRFVRELISPLDMPCPPHRRPNTRDDREAPLSSGRDGRKCGPDLPDGASDFFLSENPNGVLQAVPWSDAGELKAALKPSSRGIQ
jgi:hypothetical protein